MLLSPKANAQKTFFGFEPLKDTIEQQKQGFFILPLIYYTPDTRWAFGAAGVYYFRAQPHDGDEVTPRASFVRFLADYTQNNQLDIWSSYNVFTRNENWLLQGELRFRNFPDRFYGVGNTTLESNEERYEYNLIKWNNLMLRRVTRYLFLGFDYQFEYEYGFKYKQGGVLGSGAVNGYQGGFGSSLGAVAIYDSRDNIVNPFSGRYAEFSSYFFTKAFGSSFSFTNLNGLYQQYWEVKKNHVLATQTKLRMTIGNVPFLDMSTLGDDDILRGYASNRYRDKNMIATQVEYRFPLFWRLGGAVFAGAGDIFENGGDLSWSNLKYSIGTGLRFVIKPAERLNLRLDFGWGTEGMHYYFIVAESF